jgi:peptidoglycan lytic transglycosylase G
MRRVLLGLALVAVIASTWVGLEVLRWWEEPLRVPEGGYLLQVGAGQSLGGLADELNQAGVLSHPLLLKLYGRTSGLDQQVKRGEYLVPEFSTAESLLKQLASGKVVHYQVTFPEGITLHKALEILHSEPALKAELQGLQDERLLQLVAPISSLEGMFFPASYQYVRGESDLNILKRARQKMQDVLAKEWAGREKELPYEDAYEALVMASIIERETGVGYERAEIAGVFIRRLEKRMRLQTDPTVIYGLGPSFDGNLRRTHLADESNLFNTYRHAGLPPTPIALPGRLAIHAALHPAAGKALYFVARGDGSHEFSATLAEHERAVRKYQLKRRANYRSSPPAQNR